MRLTFAFERTCGNSGLASERIATEKDAKLQTFEVIVGIQDSLQRGLRRSARMFWSRSSRSGGNSGLASERIATPTSSISSIVDKTLVGIQDSLQRGLRPALSSSGKPSKRSMWEFRTRFREDCDPRPSGLRAPIFAACGNSGLASERIATSSPESSEGFGPRIGGNSGLASERIATDFLHWTGLLILPWEFRTRFREDCDKILLNPRKNNPKPCGNSGLASERIATVKRPSCCHRCRLVGIQDSLQRGLRLSLSYGSHKNDHTVGIQDSLQRGLRHDALILE